MVPTAKVYEIPECICGQCGRLLARQIRRTEAGAPVGDAVYTCDHCQLAWTLPLPVLVA